MKLKLWALLDIESRTESFKKILKTQTKTNNQNQQDILYLNMIFAGRIY